MAKAYYKVRYNPKTNKFKVLANVIGYHQPELVPAEIEDGIMILSDEELSMIDKKNITVLKDVKIF